PWRGNYSVRWSSITSCPPPKKAWARRRCSAVRSLWWPWWSRRWADDEEAVALWKNHRRDGNDSRRQGDQGRDLRRAGTTGVGSDRAGTYAWSGDGARRGRSRLARVREDEARRLRQGGDQLDPQRPPRRHLPGGTVRRRR